MSRLKGILFDYGHTLVWFPRYEKAHLVSARNVQRVLRNLGVSIEISQARALIESYVPRSDGTSVTAEQESRGILVSAGVKDFGRDEVQRILEAEWRPYIQNVRIRRGVRETLDYSKRMGLKLGIVANIWSGGMNPVLARTGIAEFFDTAVADMDVGYAKPDPRIFQVALDDLELTPRQVIMVGDNPKADIGGAHNLGIGTVRLMRGPNRIVPDQVEADFRIRNFSTLTSIIRRLIP